MAVPLPILGGAYTDETRPLSSQDTCNYILFPAEKAGTRTEGQLIDAPGLVPFAGVGDEPHRGARDVEGKLFVVSGNKLYQVAPTGVATEIGVIPGTGHVSITHNQIENGNQVLIGTRDNSYVYNTVTGVLAATGVPLFSVDFINQLFVGVDQGRRFWRYSALVDGTDWNSLDNEGAESSPDRIVGLIVSQGEVLVFGERTIEVWANSPNSSTAFQRVQVIERGCASPETICRLDNSVIFLGNDDILYRLEGYSPRPISTHVLTREWGNRDPRKAFAFTYEDAGRVIYYLTHKDGQTFGYDVTTGEFHRRESYGFNRWRINTLVKWNKQWYGGDFADGTLWRLQWGHPREGCDEMVRYRRTGVLSDHQRRVTVNSVELLLDMGREPSVEAEAVASVTGNMPDYQIGESVTFQYMFSGSFSGQSAVFSIASGSLPTGLTMDSSGVVTGTVTASGEFSWVVRAVGIGTCSGTGLLADSSEVVAQSWLITYTQPGGDNTSVKISPDGEDWSAAGLLPAGVWNPGNARFARNGANEILITTTTGTPRAVYSPDGGATWVAADGGWGGNATDAVCAGGYWYIGGVRAPVGATPVWSAVPGSVVDGAWGTLGTRVVCSDPGGSTFYQKFWTSDDHVTFTDRGTLGHPDNITVVGMASGDGVLGLVGHLTDSNGDYELVLMSTTTANSGSWQVLTHPFSPNPSGSFGGTCIHYDEVMELWFVSFFDQIAYGPTLDALTLSAHDFPAHIFGIGSDGQKALIVGGDGMVASSTDGATWTPITVGIPVSAIQDVIAL